MKKIILLSFLLMYIASIGQAQTKYRVISVKWEDRDKAEKIIAKSPLILTPKQKESLMAEAKATIAAYDQAVPLEDLSPRKRNKTISTLTMELCDTLGLPIKPQGEWVRIKITNRDQSNYLATAGSWIEYEYANQRKRLSPDLEDGTNYDIPGNTTSIAPGENVFFIRLHPSKKFDNAGKFYICKEIRRNILPANNTQLGIRTILKTPLVFKPEINKNNQVKNTCQQTEKQNFFSELNEPKTEKKGTDRFNKPVTMELLETLSLPIRDKREWCRIILTNNSNDEVITGMGEQIEYNNNGQWEKLPQVARTDSILWGTPGGGIKIPPHQSVLFFVWFYPSQRPYKPGRYRIIKSVGERIFEKSSGTKRNNYSKNYDLSVEFELK